jgi:prolyl-tRNA editing enzyme YbaK/EbsC (Cys-tRNA(Pro) deacylase)
VGKEDVTRALDEGGAQYELIPHAHTESALAEAEALGVEPAEVGKTIVLRGARRLRSDGHPGQPPS